MDFSIGISKKQSIFVASSHYTSKLNLGVMGEALHYVKASSMLCQLDDWNLRNSNCVPMTMSKVNATGMLLM